MTQKAESKTSAQLRDMFRSYKYRIRKDKSVISYPSRLLRNTHTDNNNNNNNNKEKKNTHEGFVFQTKNTSQRAREKERTPKKKKKTEIFFYFSSRNIYIFLISLFRSPFSICKSTTVSDLSFPFLNSLPGLELKRRTKFVEV